jgi:magnesium-transporting ATPase (P-type)
LELPVKVIPIKIKENSTIKDISKPILKKYNFNGILILLGIIILILAIIFIIIYLFRKKNKLPIVNKQKIFINPYDLALQKLNKLKKYSFNDLSDFQYFAFEISYITREYLSSILEVECLELSNTELKEKLISYDFNLKKDFFENNNYLELIKFAKFKPPIKKIESIINFTETFLIENNKIKIDEIT